MAGSQMNGVQLNGKPRGSEKPVPGCLGRMVNLFDLTSSMSGNKLLTDKPYSDGLSRSRSDVSRMSSIAVDEMEDKVMVSELRRSSSNRKTNGTPVKMLIAQEMSKDLESKQNSPNVVAKLMGLDVIPQQQSDFAVQRRFYTRNSHSEIPIGYWQEEHGFFNNQLDCETHPHQNQNDYKDIYEVWQQSQRINCRRDKSPQKGRSTENLNEKKLALIRQKFMEAKRLATDEKLRQTKEFQEALDVLSSNGDLFLKVLQEPNSLFSQQFYGGESISPSPETKRITVLRPSKMVNDEKFAAPLKRNESQVKKQVSMNHLWDKQQHGFSPTMSSWKVSDNPLQPTRIVVLKPTPAKSNETKAVFSSTPSSPRVLPGESFFEEPEDEEAREAREVAKEITQQMRENLAGHRRDETLLSSVFSNGYTGDESSFEKSENEFAAGNLSDSEVMSPTSRHSWDYVNRFGSPFSSSSFSRASFSPESSVCREAKKRLSERWAMMASNGNCSNTNNNTNHDQRHIRRSSSTLGEMLALSEIKNSEICEEEDNNKDQDPRGSTSCMNSNTGARETEEESPKNLSRSKSVPVSSTANGGRLNVEVPNAMHCNGVVSKEIMKAKTSKTSFTGKVTSLFFSRNKKARKGKSSKSVSNDESQLATAETPGFLAPPGRSSNDHSDVVFSPTSRLHGGTVMNDLNNMRLGQGICSQQGFPLSQQGAPIREHIPPCLGKSNLIDKSPPIGSIARTLSWEEPFAETATNYPLNTPFSHGVEDDEDEYLYLVQSLLTLAGFDDKEQSGLNFARWHSPDSPLDPLLRDKYMDLTAKEPLHEARKRHLRSRRKLIFDCVNAALLNITGFQMTATRTSGRPGMVFLGSDPETALADKAWAWMKELLPGEVKFLAVDNGENHSLVERLVRKEVVGKGWDEQIRLQVDSIGKEIEGKLLEELVEESVVEWIC
ncbi:Protein TRM32 [Bienertia sinuspersici]